MSNKAKKAELRTRKEKRRLKKLADEGRLVRGREIPKGAILADTSKQAPHNSYSPLLYYADREFTCLECGTVEIWTAAQQQWYYEVAKGPVYATAVRCRACRKIRREKREEQRRQMDAARRKSEGG